MLNFSLLLEFYCILVFLFYLVTCDSKFSAYYFALIKDVFLDFFFFIIMKLTLQYHFLGISRLFPIQHMQALV